MSAEQMDEAIQALREAYGEDFDAAVAGIRADAQLGRKVRALLASEEPPEDLRNAIIDGDLGNPEYPAWSWFREQLLGPAEAAPPPPSANIPEAGRGQFWGAGEPPGSLRIGGIEPDPPEKLDQAARILELEAALGDGIAALEEAVGFSATINRMEEALRGRS